MPVRSDDDPTLFRLYIAAGTPNSLAAELNLRGVLEGRTRPYLVEVIDVLQEPDKALADRVLVTPTLIKFRAGRRSTLIGRLEPRERVMPFLRCD